MKTYCLIRYSRTVYAEVRTQHETYPLRDIKDEGFEYGYGGGGPHNLAWCILCDFLGESNLTKTEWYSHTFLSMRLAHSFKNDIIAKIPQKQDRYNFMESVVQGWLAERWPEINIEEYKTNRDTYREDLRLIAKMEAMTEHKEKMVEGEMLDETVLQGQIWDEAWKRVFAFDFWLRQMTRKA
jgi:hypothetical protein